MPINSLCIFIYKLSYLYMYIWLERDVSYQLALYMYVFPSLQHKAFVNQSNKIRSLYAAVHPFKYMCARACVHIRAWKYSNF